MNKIDITLISETHMNDRKSFIMNNYCFYCTNHPDGMSHGGTAVLIKNTIKHHLHSEAREDFLQATTITVQDKNISFQGTL